MFGLFIVGFITIIVITWLTEKKQTTNNKASTNPQTEILNFNAMAKELENFRRYHHQILLDLPLGVCAINDEDEITMWNRALKKITGIGNEELAGKKITELEEPWLSILHNFLVSEYTHIYKQSFELHGKKHTVNLHMSVIEKTTVSANRRGGVLILIEDISETEILEAGLTHSERLASIGRLAAGVAHEIGNPITGIACLAQNIRDEYQDEELRTMAKQIIEQTNRTSRIVQSLVNFAHAGNLTSDTGSEIIAVRDCIDEAITLLSLDKRGKSINYEVNCSPDIEIEGDSQRLLQVFLNLIGNGRDASQPGSKITLQCESLQDGVRIVIEDEGIGIPPAIRDRVFDPFFTTKEAGEGTGLGLSLVFSIVEDLHGNIDIISPTKSKPNHGTRVILKFPNNRLHRKSNQNSNQSDIDTMTANIRDSG
jgi:PAS domain S-box-containing protein